MRRVQEWSYLSTVAEFRHHIWPHRLFDFEQLIEHFDISQVDFTAFTPDCIIMHENFKVMYTFNVKPPCLLPYIAIYYLG